MKRIADMLPGGARFFAASQFCNQQSFCFASAPQARKRDGGKDCIGDYLDPHSRSRRW